MAMAFAQPYTRTAPVGKTIGIAASASASSRPGFTGQSERGWDGCICLQPDLSLGQVMQETLSAEYSYKNHRESRFRIGLGEPSH